VRTQKFNPGFGPERLDGEIWTIQKKERQPTSYLKISKGGGTWRGLFATPPFFVILIKAPGEMEQNKLLRGEEKKSGGEMGSHIT